MQQFFTDEQWAVEAIEDQPAFEAAFEGDHGELRLVGLCDDLEERFVFYAVLPLPCPPDRRPAVAELLTRVNYGMMIGNFELDYDDGEIRYKTSSDLEDVPAHQALLRSGAFCAVTTMDLYRPAIEAVIAGTMAPSEAVDSVELEEEPELKTGL